MEVVNINFAIKYPNNFGYNLTYKRTYNRTYLKFLRAELFFQLSYSSHLILIF